MVDVLLIIAVGGLIASNFCIMYMSQLYYKKTLIDTKQQHLFLTDALVVLHAKNAREASDAMVYSEQSRAQTEQYREAFTEDIKKKENTPPVQNVGTGTILRTEDGRELEILS